MLLVDGFDSYVDDEDFAKGRWTAFNLPTLSGGFNFVGLNATGSNFTTQCLDSTGSMYSTCRLNQASHTDNETFIGFWFKATTTPGSQWTILILSEDRDNIASIATNARTFAIGMNTSGYINVKQWYDTNTTYDYTGSIACDDSTWHWFEARLHWNNSTGDVETYIDGSSDIAVILSDTISAASPPTFTGYRFATMRGNSGWSWDDMIIYDVDGSPSGTPTSGSFPLGESKIETLRPTGSGTNADWTSWGISLSGNWDATNKLTCPFDNYEHVWADTNNDTDTYAFGNLSDSPTEIHTLLIDHYIRTTGDSTVYVKGVAYSNSTTGVTSSRQLKAIGFRLEQHEMPYDPDTGSLWTGSGVDAAEFGLRYSTT
jgi:hypothetical protein